MFITQLWFWIVNSVHRPLHKHPQLLQLKRTVLYVNKNVTKIVLYWQNINILRYCPQKSLFCFSFAFWHFNNIKCSLHNCGSKLSTLCTDLYINTHGFTVEDESFVCNLGIMSKECYQSSVAEHYINICVCAIKKSP